MGTWARNSTWKYIKCGKEADDILVEPPSGKKTIDSTAEVDVSSYATAQVVDENLTAENIKKDVSVLGITGSYEGGGSSDFSTAEVTVIAPDNFGIIPAIFDTYLSPVVTRDISVQEETYIVPLYKGEADFTIFAIDVSNYTISLTGSIQSFANYGYLQITGDGTITVTAST